MQPGFINRRLPSLPNLGVGLPGLLTLFSAGQPGHWPDSYNPARGRLFQDAAGTTPVTAPGQPVGLVKRMAGTVDASQGTALSRPTLGRWPKGGRRNMLTWTEDLAIAPWSRSPFISAVKVSDEWWEIAREAGAAGASNVVQPLGAVPNGIAYSLTMELSAGTATSVAVGLHRGNWNASTTSIEKISGPGTVSIIGVGIGYITGLSPTETTKIKMTRVTDPTDTGTNLTLMLYPVNSSNALGSVKIKRPQVEAGEIATPYQRVTTEFDVTETGVPDVWHLYNDGGDSLPVTLPAGTYGRARVNTEGVVTIDTVVNPTDALSGTRQVDMILRQGAFSAVEEAQIRAYWARYAA